MTKNMAKSERIMIAVAYLVLCCCWWSVTSGSLLVPGEPQQYTRYVARVMYDGTSFRGWQDQAVEKSREGTRIRTVQGVLTKQLSSRFNKKVTCTGASRTDLGVHSRGQAIHFDVWNQAVCEDLPHLEYCLNRMLPDDVRIFNVSAAPLGKTEQVMIGEPWHATKSATGKLYVYRFCTNEFVDPMLRRYCTHVYVPTDMELLDKCLQVFPGKLTISHASHSSWP